MMVIVPIFYSLFISVLGIYLNSKYLNFNWTSEIQVVKQSMAVMLSIFIAMLIIVLPIIIVSIFSVSIYQALIIVSIILFIFTLLLYKKVLNSKIF